MATIRRQLAEAMKFSGDLTTTAAAKAKAAAQVRSLVSGQPEGKLSKKTTEDALAYAGNLQRGSADASNKEIAAGTKQVFELRKKLDAAAKARDIEQQKILKAEIKAEQDRVRTLRQAAQNRQRGMAQLNRVIYQPAEKAREKAESEKRKAEKTEAERQAGLGRMRHVSREWQEWRPATTAWRNADAGRPDQSI
jgi:hypothetical protein